MRGLRPFVKANAKKEKEFYVHSLIVGEASAVVRLEVTQERTFYLKRGVNINIHLFF